MKLEIINSSWHRNGVSGTGLYAILFNWIDGSSTRRMVATLFDEPGSCAVLEVSQLANDNGVSFGYNSWRGDRFEDDLRVLIEEKCFNRVGPFSL